MVPPAYDPEVHAALLKAYGKWDTVMMPVHAADHACLSFEKTALPVAIERGVDNQAIKVFGKAFLLRSLGAGVYTGSTLEYWKQRNSEMDIKRSGSQPSGKGPAEYFTGTVRIDPLFNPPAPARAFGASVTFEPGARTAWHTHPLGQTLIVTAGCGRVQRWGGPVEEIRPGDVVWIPPGEKHWHGATPTTAMTHIAIQEQLDGKTADWMETVTDEQYRA